MNRGDRIVVVDGVMARQVGEQTVILDLASGTYFGLDTVGTFAWRLIEQGKSFDEICAGVFEAFEAPREEIERDLGELVDRLWEKKLIRLQRD